ncbi:hypothetical protein BAUCODRAFT_34074 [Baudoinia panamericana UAMH 10762]|uniref:Copper acquisition factor BIM1-like domain-containing protein n=1 Tax=Baudoinia panamericana (strain UAMH 10762) TaxID=717646 RepID=M2MYL1_BAUPA|nr:uncharacterized protein BAUCODRAFT_34074 [Baudoinia panamericana UAMH 10762]EMC96688.1 hypothetical protein BAUCODRAFT_34074 [Baudoinia panamericana UAMH 10762]
MMLFKTLLGLAVASLTSAHFILQWPPTAGFDDDLEPNAPCGGANVVSNSSNPQVQVGQFALSILNTHPAGEWLFRATTDTVGLSNFTTISPIVNTTGVGSFCLTNMMVPSFFAGSAGVIQVVDNSVDGVLYQCAPVNFVSGSNTTVGSSCSNATGFSAVRTGMTLNGFSANSSQASASSSAAASGSATASRSGSATASAATATSSAAAAVATGLSGLAGGLGLLAAGLIL